MKLASHSSFEGHNSAKSNQRDEASQLTRNVSAVNALLYKTVLVLLQDFRLCSSLLSLLLHLNSSHSTYWRLFKRLTSHINYENCITYAPTTWKRNELMVKRNTAKERGAEITIGKRWVENPFIRYSFSSISSSVHDNSLETLTLASLFLSARPRFSLV